MKEIFIAPSVSVPGSDVQLYICPRFTGEREWEGDSDLQLYWIAAL